MFHALGVHETKERCRCKNTSLLRRYRIYHHDIYEIKYTPQLYQLEIQHALSEN